MSSDYTSIKYEPIVPDSGCHPYIYFLPPLEKISPRSVEEKEVVTDRIGIIKNGGQFHGRTKRRHRMMEEILRQGQCTIFVFLRKPPFEG